MTTMRRSSIPRTLVGLLALLAFPPLAFAEPAPAEPPRVAARAVVDPKERAAWAERASARILSRTRHPHGEETDPTPKRVMLRFRIDAAGRVSEAGIEAGSGDAALDAAAVAGLEAASPLPKPPWPMLTSAGTANLRLAVNFVGSPPSKPARRR